MASPLYADKRYTADNLLVTSTGNEAVETKYSESLSTVTARVRACAGGTR